MVPGAAEVAAACCKTGAPTLLFRLQETGKQLQSRESRLKELRERRDRGAQERSRHREESLRTQQMLEDERGELQRLHQEALGLREACRLAGPVM